ncbi:MAG TPA: hypothetical protein VGK19_21340 [Capsulimonadaceae bacterium]
MEQLSTDPPEILTIELDNCPIKTMGLTVVCGDVSSYEFGALDDPVVRLTKTLSELSVKKIQAEPQLNSCRHHSRVSSVKSASPLYRAVRRILPKIDAFPKPVIVIPRRKKRVSLNKPLSNLRVAAMISND